MCGRFTLTSTPEALAQRFGLDAPPALAARYNIAPGQDVLVVRQLAHDARRAAFLRWGLVPPWAEARDTGARRINARVESVAQKPSFREAFRARRCLVPADGFYEWADHGGFRQPFRIALRGDALFAFAGLWERRVDAQGECLESCAILTQDASPALRAIHPRMPVVLPEDAYATWLDPTLQEVAPLHALLRDTADPGFLVRAVSTRVNHPRFDDPACALPVPAAPRQESLF
jgi:putative SOS response-associated peptidase YedK